MHPSIQIRERKSSLLSGKRIALAVTGSIAAVETVKIARELIRHGADVYPYMSRSAKKFIGKEALVFATGHQVVDELSGMDEHLQDFDLILVAPATADVISKAACGIADDAVSTLILGNLRICMFVPAMHSKMYENPILRENMEKLKRHVVFVESKSEEGEMKVPSREKIAAAVIHELHRELRGKRVLVIGGAGYEFIDDFRIITNLSTGKTAVELAKYAYYMGAEVKLLLGLSSVESDIIPAERFSTVNELIERIPQFMDYDIIIVPAALPDFKPARGSGKIKIEQMNEMKWVENEKFLKKLGENYSGFLVGFKAEAGVSDEVLIARARARMEEYNLSMVVANRLENVSADKSEVLVIREDVERIRGKKEDIALEIMRRIAHEVSG